MSDADLISNRFRLESLIGQGGMGSVYRGTDTLSGDPVAVKIIKPEVLAQNPQVVSRFTRESEALQALNHPNIVDVIASVTKKQLVLVMEFIPGQSLREMIENEEPINLRRAMEIGLDVADALTRAHRLKIIHRDIKPENILVDEEGRPYLTDFGLARFTGVRAEGEPRLTEEGAILGTLDYLSPEALQGEELDERTDIWAFGICLYEMLSKRKPFNEPTIAATLTAILTKSIPPIDAWRPDVPEPLTHLIGRMLEKDRRQRISSVRQVGAELEMILRESRSEVYLIPSSGTLLETKLFVPPPRADIVARGRLIEKLNSQKDARLILVSAPAGFGKTTLVAHWVKQNQLTAAWVSLDVADNDPIIFLTYLLSAMQSVAPNFGSVSLSMLRSSTTSTIGDVLPVLINELFDLQEDIFLILDDYHLIESEEIHAALSALISNQLQRLHIVLCSRSDPPLPLSRLRARGQLAEVRQKDLLFSVDEAAAFLNQGAGLDLSFDQIKALETKTEGWIAGLQLAALSLADKKDMAAFIEEFSGSHRFVLDYLADEVVLQLPESLRSFMLSTAILDRFNAQLCDALTGQTVSTSILRRLEEANLFLMPLDENRQWYRYHQLFGDFLRFQLDQKTKSALHVKAAGWYLDHGYFSEGVDHALASGDDDLIIDAIAAAAPDAFNQGAFVRLLRWLDSIPEGRLLANTDLTIIKGFTLFLVESDKAARPYLQAAEVNLAPEASTPTRGRLLSLRAQIAMCDSRLGDAKTLAEEALNLLSETDESFRNLTRNVLGQVLELNGDVPAAAMVYRQAFSSSWQAGDQIGALVVFVNLIFALNEIGQRHEALGMCQQLTDSLKKQGVPLVDAVDLPHSLLSFEANDLDRALLQSQHALKLLSAANFHQGVLWAIYIQARIYLALGEYSELFRTVADGNRLAIRVDRESVQGSWFAALEAEAHIQQGDLTKASAWVNSKGYRAEDKVHHWQEYPYFTYVHLLLAQGRFSEARMLLSTMAKSAEAGGRIRKLITIHLLKARALESGADKEEIRYHLEQAVMLADSGDYYRAVLDEGAEIVRNLSQVRGAAPAFVDKLLEMSGQFELITPEDQRLIEPLSRREQQVLELAAAGLSNREIAEALFVTVGTVKKHLNNIFSKLGVKSRTEAAARGRELGLLK